MNYVLKAVFLMLAALLLLSCSKSNDKASIIDPRTGKHLAEWAVADIGGKAVAKAKSGGGKVPAKYRNASTGDSWSGRGLQPRWLKAALASGRKLSDFAV